MSWAEDNILDFWDSEDFRPYHSRTREYEWEVKDHSVKLIRDLSESHIQNIVRRFEDFHSPDLFWGQDWKLGYLRNELKRRSDERER